jgi:hypothetical protein
MSEVTIDIQKEENVIVIKKDNNIGFYIFVACIIGLMYLMTYYLPTSIGTTNLFLVNLH